MFNKSENDRRVSFQNNIESVPVVEIPSPNAKPGSRKTECDSFTGHFNKSYEVYEDEKKDEIINATNEKEENVSGKWERFGKDVELKADVHKDIDTPKIASDAPPPYTPIATTP